MEQMIKELRAITHRGVSPEVLVDCGKDKAKYDEKRLVFNRKFQFRPTAIVLCTCAEHVSAVIIITAKYNWEIKVRSGGHDHEGECSATDVVVIDFSSMENAVVDTKAGTARVEPGAVFVNLVPILNAKNVGIPHGTCGTVRIAGFTFGGGWGPWTRQQGMACESLIGATIVLGDGSIKKLTETGPDKELLWALRGGGGMSYGIVTELVFKTFPLPKNTIKFNIVWLNTPALKVLEAWENLIAPKNNPRLLGTNLKIMGKPYDGKPVKNSVHECVFYGYYSGTLAQLRADLKKWFAKVPPTYQNIPLDADANELMSFSGWDRISTEARQMKVYGNNPLKLIPPDYDAPGPHKITSRLVREEGLGKKGHVNLIKSLESTLIHQAGEDAGVYCYVTLGAISGQYYKNYKPAKNALSSAFPYKKRPYIIQYQAWWMEGEKNIEKGEKNHVYCYSNEAQDWIEECRQMNFPQTEGAFISFKDSSVPTQEYFLQSFERLKKIKEQYTKDPNNRLRSRKTII